MIDQSPQLNSTEPAPADDAHHERARRGRDPRRGRARRDPPVRSCRRAPPPSRSRSARAGRCSRRPEASTSPRTGGARSPRAPAAARARGRATATPSRCFRRSGVRALLILIAESDQGVAPRALDAVSALLARASAAARRAPSPRSSESVRRVASSCSRRQHAETRPSRVTDRLESTVASLWPGATRALLDLGSSRDAPVVDPPPRAERLRPRQPGLRRRASRAAPAAGRACDTASRSPSAPAAAR